MKTSTYVLKTIVFQINDYKHKLSQMSNVKMTGNMKSTLNGKSCWEEKNDYTPLTCKNCCELATILLENFEEKTRLYQQPSTSTNPEKPFSDYKSTSYYHDDSKCYCSLPTNSDRRINNAAAIGVGKSNDSLSISNSLNCADNIKCCVCNVSN